MQLRPRQKANGSLAPNWLKNVYVVDITQIRYNTKRNKKCLAHAQRLPPQCVTLIFVNHLKLSPNIHVLALTSFCQWPLLSVAITEASEKDPEIFFFLSPILDVINFTI